MLLMRDGHFLVEINLVSNHVPARYFTAGQGNYMISAMEDSGSMQALTFLDQAGRVDLNRVLVLLTVSNYDRQAPGATAAESLKGTTFGAYSA
jgi:purine nucleoside permease